VRQVTAANRQTQQPQQQQQQRADDAAESILSARSSRRTTPCSYLNQQLLTFQLRHRMMSCLV